MNNNQIMLGVLLTTLLLLLLVAGIFVAIYMAAKTRAQQELAYEKELRQVELEVSENMMAQFARELHDNIGHLLTCMRITIENKKLAEPENNAFSAIEGYLDDASTQLRLLSRSLNTDYISNIGLSAAINLEVDRINQLKRSQISLTLADATLEMDKNAELMIFRIFQEMMQNSLKHSKAKNIYVVLFGTPDQLLSVTDDGKGFDVARMLDGNSASGLKNMIKRAQLAGLSCEIISNPGEGCRYTLHKTATF